VSRGIWQNFPRKTVGPTDHEICPSNFKWWLHTWLLQPTKWPFSQLGLPKSRAMPKSERWPGWWVKVTGDPLHQVTRITCENYLWRPTEHNSLLWRRSSCMGLHWRLQCIEVPYWLPTSLLAHGAASKQHSFYYRVCDHVLPYTRTLPAAYLAYALNKLCNRMNTLRACSGYSNCKFIIEVSDTRRCEVSSNCT
jgi:hypothetical protein